MRRQPHIGNYRAQSLACVSRPVNGSWCCAGLTSSTCGCTSLQYKGSFTATIFVPRLLRRPCPLVLMPSKLNFPASQPKEFPDTTVSKLCLGQLQFLQSSSSQNAWNPASLLYSLQSLVEYRVRLSSRKKLATFNPVLSVLWLTFGTLSPWLRNQLVACAFFFVECWCTAKFCRLLLQI